MHTQKETWKWFKINRDNIVKGHEGQYSLLYDNSLIGYYKNEEAAILDAITHGMKVGDFLVQPCIEHPEPILVGAMVLGSL